MSHVDVVVVVGVTNHRSSSSITSDIFKDQSKTKKIKAIYTYPANTAESLVCLSLRLIMRCWLGINSFDLFFSFDIKESHWTGNS